MSYENPTDTEKALDLAQRCVKFLLWTSMTDLRKTVKSVLKGAGLQKELRNFKLKKTDEDTVTVYLRPGVEAEITDL